MVAWAGGGLSCAASFVLQQLNLFDEQHTIYQLAPTVKLSVHYHIGAILTAGPTRDGIPAVLQVCGQPSCKSGFTRFAVPRAKLADGYVENKRGDQTLFLRELLPAFFDLTREGKSKLLTSGASTAAGS